MWLAQIVEVTMRSEQEKESPELNISNCNGFSKAEQDKIQSSQSSSSSFYMITTACFMTWQEDSELLVCNINNCSDDFSIIVFYHFYFFMTDCKQVWICIIVRKKESHWITQTLSWLLVGFMI